MNVSELIAELQKYDGNLMVVVEGMEGGVEEVTYTLLIGVILNQHQKDEWWFGKHEQTRYDGQKDGRPSCDGLPRRATGIRETSQRLCVTSG